VLNLKLVRTQRFRTLWSVVTSAPESESDKVTSLPIVLAVPIPPAFSSTVFAALLPLFSLLNIFAQTASGCDDFAASRCVAKPAPFKLLTSIMRRNSRSAGGEAVHFRDDNCRPADASKTARVR
jgi:hypothetical protein